jgi:hypothetical protein
MKRVEPIAAFTVVCHIAVSRFVVVSGCLLFFLQICLVEFHAFGIHQGAWDIILYDFGFLFYLFAFRAALCIIASLPCTSLHHVDFAHKAAWMAFPSFSKKISGLFRIIWYHP